MDPYLILKLRRDCTRTELKEIFRAKVRLDHPDHGGDERQFIKLCEAYKMILSELDGLAENERSSRTANNAKRSTSSDSAASRSTVDPYVKLLRNVSKAEKSKSRPKSSDVPGNSSQMNQGAIIGGLVALVFYLIGFLTVLLNDDNSNAIPAAASPVGQRSRTPPSQADTHP